MADDRTDAVLARLFRQRRFTAPRARRSTPWTRSHRYRHQPALAPNAIVRTPPTERAGATSERHRWLTLAPYGTTFRSMRLRRVAKRLVLRSPRLQGPDAFYSRSNFIRRRLCSFAISTSPVRPAPAPATPPTSSSPAYPSRFGTGATRVAKYRKCWRRMAWPTPNSTPPGC